MKIKWWPWGLLTAISLILLLFFVLYPLGVLFANSVTGPDGGYTLQGFARCWRTRSTWRPSATR